MKKVIKGSNIKVLALLLILLGSSEIYAQYGYGNSSYGSRGGYGNQRSSIPQAQTPAEPPKPKTAEELVDDEMPRITEALALNEFEQAVLSSVLKKYVQERIEAQILKLPP
ncbi:MAG: hypothetical protein ABJI11_06265, partial [Maribacter sp.]